MHEKTLTVAELIALLQTMPQDAPVYCEGTETDGEAVEERHVCGLSGYDGMRDPPCPGCGAHR